jgi:hypothetical protein
VGNLWLDLLQLVQDPFQPTVGGIGLPVQILSLWNQVQSSYLGLVGFGNLKREAQGQLRVRASPQRDEQMVDVTRHCPPDHHQIARRVAKRVFRRDLKG